MAKTATTSCSRARLMRPSLRLSAPISRRAWAAALRTRDRSACMSTAPAEGAGSLGLGVDLHRLDDVANGIAERRWPLRQGRELAELGDGKRLHAEVAAGQILDTRRGREPVPLGLQRRDILLLAADFSAQLRHPLRVVGGLVLDLVDGHRRRDE